MADYLCPMTRLSDMISKLEDHGYDVVVHFESEVQPLLRTFDFESVDGLANFEAVDKTRERTCSIRVSDTSDGNECDNTYTRQGRDLFEAIERACLAVYSGFPMVANSSPTKYDD